MNPVRSICTMIALAAAWCAHAAGPKSVATMDRAKSPVRLDSPAAFDRASKAELLAMLSALQTFEWDASKLQKEFGLKSANGDSLSRWRRDFEARMLSNLKLAQEGCAAEKTFPCNVRVEQDVAKLIRESRERLPREHSDWWTEATAFHSSYVAEQARLALLFPAVTSEILPISDGELFGTEMKDREFLLTFDDGPTHANGMTDKVAGFLRAEKLSAVFFVLGDAFVRRREKSDAKAMQSLYAGHCVGSHTREHKQLPRVADWKASLEGTFTNIRAAVHENGRHLFMRPPYGQRTAEQTALVEKLGGKTMLWNIDSQDWHSRVNAERMRDRVLTLMLVHRKGIVLFHDVHAKALSILPNLLEDAKTTGLTWADCRSL